MIFLKNKSTAKISNFVKKKIKKKKKKGKKSVSQGTVSVFTKSKDQI